VRKLLIGLLLTAACTSRTATVNGPGTPQAGGPRPALDAFLASVRAQDLQAMAGVWGDRDGSVRDSNKMSRDEMEKRELLLMCYFRHDKYRVLGETPGTNGERVFQVELTRGTIHRTTNFYITAGGDRWYVRNADIEPVKDLCAERRQQR
jgi:hypothetical protein